MAIATLNSNAEDQKESKKKNLSWLFGDYSDGYLYPHLKPIQDSYNLFGRIGKLW